MKSCVRFETFPGEEVQVDFGYVGMMFDKGGKKKAYVFNVRLSYRRYDYYEVVFDQKIETWIRCNVNAFNYFGRVPKMIKLDNLKSGVTKVSIYEPLYQQSIEWQNIIRRCSGRADQESHKKKGKRRVGSNMSKTTFLQEESSRIMWI